MLRPGDILTHCYRPGPNSALGPDGSVLPEVRAARERGVLFDIAHGMGAFGYETTEGALSHGFPPDVISSDVHVIAVEGPGFDLLHTMSKLLNCGLTLPQVIAMSANRPALAIRRPELGHLGVGAPADITVLRQVDSDYVFEDVVGATRQGSTIAAAGFGLSGWQADGNQPPAVRGAVHSRRTSRTPSPLRLGKR